MKFREKLFFKNRLQLDAMDCGPACLQSIAANYGKSYLLSEIRKLSYLSKDGVSLLGLAKAAENIGFRTRGVKIGLDILAEQAKLPCILHWRQEHFVVLYKVKKKKGNYLFYIADPAAGKIRIDSSDMEKGWLNCYTDGNWTGICLLMEPTSQFYAKVPEVKKLNISFILRYLIPYKRFLFQLVLSFIIGAVLQLIFPFLTQAIVDKGIYLKNLKFIYLILAGQLFFSLSNAVVNYVRSILLLHISSRINISMLSDFIAKLLNLPINFFDKKFTGDLLQRIKDHEKIETFLISHTLNIAFNVISIIIFSIILLLYSNLIFLIFLIGSIVYVLWIVFFLRRRKEIDYKRFIVSSQNQSNIYQLINGVQDIKLNNCEIEKRWGWESIQVKLFKISLDGVKLEQLQAVGANLINEIKNICITFMSAILVIDGNISLGSMLAIQYINGQLNYPVVSLIKFIYSFQDAKIALERLGEVHLHSNEKQNSIVSVPEYGDITLKDVSFRYGDPYAKMTLDNINLNIHYGKTTAIVGLSGAGKTTLFKLLLGFYSPEKGEILIGGESLESLNIREWRDKCGVVMQDGYIFSDTIANNICVKPDIINKERLLLASDGANITEFIMSLPLKFDTKIGDEGVGLSQGQKQRILIARAIYKNPDYLFFDEATNSLDSKNERFITNNLKKYISGKTIVIIAHRLSTIRYADKIIVLDEGRIVEEGNHSELLLNKGAYYSLIQSQL